MYASLHEPSKAKKLDEISGDAQRFCKVSFCPPPLPRTLNPAVEKYFSCKNQHIGDQQIIDENSFGQCPSWKQDANLEKDRNKKPESSGDRKKQCTWHAEFCTSNHEQMPKTTQYSYIINHNIYSF